MVAEEPGTETLRVPVLKVFDGDGFLTRIRNPLRGSDANVVARFGFTDAPEMEQPGGQEAKAFLISLIEGRWVDLVILLKMDTGGIFDRHGRVVCVPYLRENGAATRNIELEMILNGWTWVLDRYEPDDRYFDALEDAKRHRRGIWAFDSNVHPWDFKRQKYRRRGVPAAADTQATLFPVHHKCPMPKCEGKLVTRHGRFGPFLGCSKYPTCNYSHSVRD